MDKNLLKLAALSFSAILFQPAQASVFSSWAPAEQEVFELVNLQRALNNLNILVADSRLHDAATAHSADMSVNNFFSHTGTGNTDSSNRITAAGYNWTSAGENIAAGYGAAFTSGVGITLISAENAARQVMYGTSSLTEISDYSTSNGGQAFADWAVVGTGWNNSFWDGWHSSKGGSGGWMGSSGHRNNILTGLYTDLGVGLVFDSNDQPNVKLDNATLSGPYYSYWTQNFASGDTSPVPVPSAFLLFASAIPLFRLAKRQQSKVA